MKKIYAILLCALFAVAAQAQIVSSHSSRITYTETKTEKEPIFHIDLGVGFYTGDVEDTGMAIDLGFRWTKMFTPYFGWDIFKASAQSDVSNFSDLLNFQAKTGVRGVTPVLFGEKGTIFGNFGLGYGYYYDPEEGGFAWEIGGGVNFNSRCALSIVYNGCGFDKHDEDFNIGVVSLRFSYGF